jgi:uncharacterized RDD family membrane protein YckC
MSQLVTGEAVALDLRPAALPSRLLAGLLDALLQFLILLVFGALATAVSLDLSEAAASAIGIVVLITVLIVYPVTFETLLRGRTPGKAALGLRVVRDDGGPIGFRQALVRGLVGAVLERPGITFFTGAVVTSLLNDQGKRLGDLLAGTLVLRERVSVRGGAVAAMPPLLAGWAATLDLSTFPDELALAMRQFVSRADQLTEIAREELGGRLVKAVTEIVGPAPSGAPGWAVLAAVLAERRRRDTERLSDGGYLTRPPAGASPAGASPAGASPGGAPSPDPLPAAPAPPTRESPPSVGPGGFAAPF